MTRLLALALACCGLLACNSGADDKKEEKKDGKGVEVTIDGLKSRAPADWTEEEPKDKRMRFKQFRLPKGDGDKFDTELVLFFFGPGAGGGLDQNITRWKGLMTAPEGKSIDDLFKVEKFKVGDVAVTYTDVEATYKGPPFGEKIEPRPNYRMINVYFDSKNGPYFFRLLGPAKTVEKHKKGFDDWLKAFK